MVVVAEAGVEAVAAAAGGGVFRSCLLGLSVAVATDGGGGNIFPSVWSEAVVLVGGGGGVLRPVGGGGGVLLPGGGVFRSGG